jgi:Homeodomain-like domain
VTVALAVGVDLAVDEATEITGRIKRWVKECPVSDIKRAYFGRVWLALGYDNWSDWCATELGGFKLPPVVRRDAVADLAAAGMSQRAIAEAAGVSEATVRRDRGATNDAADPKPVTGQDGKVQKRKPKRPVVDQPAADTVDDEFTTAYNNARQSLVVLRAASTEYQQVKQAGHLLYKHGGIFRQARREMDNGSHG